VDTELAALEQASQGDTPNPLYFSWNKNNKEADAEGRYELQVNIHVSLAFGAICRSFCFLQAFSQIVVRISARNFF
jgi:hypothetical protein